MATFSFFNEAEHECCKSILPSVEFDTILNKADVEAALEESAYDAACRVCMENTRNWNAILQACAITEFAHFEQTHTEFVYEGAKLDAFFDKAKEFFVSIWKKIQEIFKAAVAQFAAWFKTDKDFISKYENLINTSIGREFGDKEVSIYKFTVLDGADDMTKTIKEADADAIPRGLSGNIASVLSSDILDDVVALNKEITEDKITDVLDTMRGTICGESSVTTKEFAKQLREKISGEKEDVKLAEALEPAIKYLKNSKTIKETLDRALRDCKEQIDKSIEAIEKDRTQLTRDSKGANAETLKLVNAKQSIMTKMIRTDKGAKEIMTQAVGIYIDVMKKASRQSKAVCMKALTYSDKSDKENKRQSVLHTESSMQLLDGLQLI